MTSDESQHALFEPGRELYNCTNVKKVELIFYLVVETRVGVGVLLAQQPVRLLNGRKTLY